MQQERIKTAFRLLALTFIADRKKIALSKTLIEYLESELTRFHNEEHEMVSTVLDVIEVLERKNELTLSESLMSIGSSIFVTTVFNKKIDRHTKGFMKHVMKHSKLTDKHLVDGILCEYERLKYGTN